MAEMDDGRFVKIAKALADPTRLRIFQAVAQGRRLCCGDVGRRFQVSQATVSHHLRVLAEAGLVESRRDGQLVRVQAVPGTLDAYRAAVERLATCGCRPDEGETRRAPRTSDRETAQRRPVKAHV